MPTCLFRPLLILLASATIACPLIAGPFTVSLTDDPALLASMLFGPGISIVGTPTLSSQPGQSGLFTDFNSGPYTQSDGATGQFNVSSGIILTSGIASGAEGAYIGGPSYDANGAGDASLTALSGANTVDADVLTIRFASTLPTLNLNFLFASAEYPGSVGSGFGNDPVGIFVNGTNVAVVPGTSMPVSIETVNAAVNSGFFTQYSNVATPFNYGGVTTILSATAAVSTSNINTIQFAVADAGDGSVDSALLIQGAGSSAVPEPDSLILGLAGLSLIGWLVSRGPREGKVKELSSAQSITSKGF